MGLLQIVWMNFQGWIAESARAQGFPDFSWDRTLGTNQWRKDVEVADTYRSPAATGVGENSEAGRASWLRNVFANPFALLGRVLCRALGRALQGSIPPKQGVRAARGRSRTGFCGGAKSSTHFAEEPN